MSNSTTIPLQGPLLLLTQLELVTPTTVAGTLYGIAFTLFCLYTQALVTRLRNGDRTRQAQFMLAYSTVIMLCGLYDLVSNAWVAQDAYIRHSSYPGGPYTYVLSIFSTTPVIPVGLVCQVTIDILTTAIQVWRVWVIWSATPYANLIAVLPILCFLTFTGLRLRTVILQTTVSIAKEVELDNKTDQVEIAIQGSTTLLTTLLISLYLVFKQWQQRKLIGKSQGSDGYVNIVAMIIESYALESIWLLATAILWNNASFAFFAESAAYIEIIAYLLVQYRVASGNSYESQGERRNMSSLHWNRSNRVTMELGEAGEICGSHHVSVVPEASYTARASSMA